MANVIEIGEGHDRGNTGPRSNRTKRSRPSGSEEEGEDADILFLGDPDTLVCPICCETLFSPVFQCDNGHIACDSCCKKIYRCPSCSLQIGMIRNRAIEKVIESTKTVCVNKRYGCKEKISFQNKLDHEKICKSAPVTCPHLGCGYLGIPKTIFWHFFAEHSRASRAPTSRLFILGSAIPILVGRFGDHIILLEKNENLLFVINRVVEPRGSVLSVRCVAPISSDMKFTYKIAAKAGEKSISLKNVVELTPNWILQAAAEKNTVVIPNDFRFGRGNVIVVKITIKKVNLAGQAGSHSDPVSRS